MIAARVATGGGANGRWTRQVVSRALEAGARLPDEKNRRPGARGGARAGDVLSRDASLSRLARRVPCSLAALHRPQRPDRRGAAWASARSAPRVARRGERGVRGERRG